MDASVEVWVNELRLQGLSNRGGVAAIARADLQLADLGNITTSFNYSSVGWGQIDQQLQERSLEKITEFDVAANLELGKFFPKKWGMRVPFYYQYAQSTSTPEYDPLELDLTKDELLSNPNLTETQRTDIIERQDDITKISTFNFTNVRKERTGEGTPKPWDISNISASYAFSKTEHRDEIIKDEVTIDQRGELVYSYNAKSKPIQPFKGIKSKALRFIKEFNFNPVPSSFLFNTQMQRYKSSKLFRLPDPAEGFEYVFDDQRFTWDRNYSLSWDLAKNLKLNFDASASAVVDQLKQVGVASTAENRRWKDVDGNLSPPGEGQSYSDIISADPGFVGQYEGENLRNLGRMKVYNQGVSLSYNLPLKYLPGLDWINAQAQYNGDYSWNAGSRIALDLGNVIQNSQRRTLRATLDFEKLYEKIGYFKRLEGKNRRSSRSRTRSTGGDDKKEDDKKNKANKPASTIEKIFLRPLLSIRELKFNYSEDLSTTIPGYSKTPKFFGLTGSDPGWGFVLGLQPDLDPFFAERASSRTNEESIITPSDEQNQQVIQTNSQTYEADLTIEPWKGFSVEVDFSKRYTENFSEYYIYTGDDNRFQALTKRNFGSYEVSYIAMNTLFDGDIDGLFDRFDFNRQVISSRLPNNTSAAHSKDLGYAEGYGRQHVDVLIPAFIAAYTNQDPLKVNLDQREVISKRGYIPKPNWNIRYNGLSKLPLFKDLFSSITLNHSYKTSLAVNSFQTDLAYDSNNRFTIDPLISTANYFSRFEVPEIVINEQFQPIIGVDLKTKSDLTLNADYSKTRSLRLSTSLAQLTEVRSTGLTMGIGWIFQDVNIGFLTGNTKKRQRKRKKKEDPDNPDNPPIDPLDLPVETPEEDKGGINSGGVNKEANRLEFAFNMQFRDDVTYIHELGDGSSKEPTRGTKSFTVAPQLNYDVNKNFVLSFFFEYSSTRPYLSTAFPITNINGGFTARFILD